MAKRKQSHEPEFGSDSFLDVVANIVGILIILIVVAGVRVSQTPTPQMAEPPSVQVVAIEEAEVVVKHDSPTRIVDVPIEAMIAQDAPKPIPPPAPEVFAPLPEVQVPQQIVDKIDDLNAKNQQIAEQLQALEKASQQVTALKQMTAADAEKLKKELTLTTTELESQQALLTAAQQIAVENDETVALLRQRVKDAASHMPQKETLKHQLPPIGKVVTGKEIHFRLINNQISHVPVDNLGDLMLRDVQRRRDVILARQVYKGSAGPLEGYEMSYVIQRQSMTLFEEARTGQAVVRMGITGWVIEPNASVITENFEQATKINSRFRSALLVGGTSSTVTFWVYPDSFEIHQQLKSYLNDTGYWVASRPLPEGVPIAGSPTGSKSFAQ